MAVADILLCFCDITKFHIYFRLGSLKKEFSCSGIKVLCLQNELFDRNQKGSICLSIVCSNRFVLQMKNVFPAKVRKRKRFGINLLIVR